jgi:hypothetical protein
MMWTKAFVAWFEIFRRFLEALGETAKTLGSTGALGEIWTWDLPNTKLESYPVDYDAISCWSDEVMMGRTYWEKGHENCITDFHKIPLTR